MEKFSLYELLSFILPGFVACKICQWYAIMFHCNFNFQNLLNWQNGIMLLLFSLIAGFVLFHFTGYLRTKKFYQKHIHFSVQSISSKKQFGFVQRTIPFLNTEYIRLRKHNEKKVLDNQPEHNLFDFCYYYLEANDKIAAAKVYQNFYYLLTNLLTLALLNLVLCVVALLIGLFIKADCQFYCQLFFVFIATLLVGTICFYSAPRMRKILITKIFWSYYVDRIHQSEK